MVRDPVGASWWRFDFHTHTPASEDYGKGPRQTELREREPRDWLLDFMSAGIDCVAVTDHNTGAWIDRLKDAYGDLEKHPQRRPLTLFPGVEITVSGGIHVLAILDPSKGTSDVDTLLGEAGLEGDKGSGSASTRRSFEQVVEAIVRAGGLAIPAHVDRPMGLFEVRKGKTLRGAMESGLAAVEVHDPRFPSPATILDHRLWAARVLGSDCHHPRGAPDQRYPGSHYTWVKMCEPSFDGLRLALLDGHPLSLLRSDVASGDPNEHAKLVIEGIEITEARVAGRGRPMQVRFSPWMSAIIGGRGTGKSTILELLRLGLRRERELPADLAEEFRRFAGVAAPRSDRGALTERTSLAITVLKDDARYKVLWRQDGSGPAIEEETPEAWRPSPGEVRGRFPVRILSQKQVFALAVDPSSLLHLIDEAPKVGRAEWEALFDELKARYSSLRTQARELATRLGDRARLEGELADIRRQLAVFEEGGHRDLLVDYQRLGQQRRVFRNRETEIERATTSLRQAATEIEPTDLRDDPFDRDEPAETAALELLREAVERQRNLSESVRSLAEDLNGFRTAWSDRVESSPWFQKRSITEGEYAALVERLQEEGVENPADFGGLVQKRLQLEGKLAELGSLASRREDLEKQAADVLRELEELRCDLSRRRMRFLQEVLAGNEFVRITVVPFGESAEEAESLFRNHLSREDGRLADDIRSTENESGLLNGVYSHLPSEPERRIAEVAKRTRQVKEHIVAVHQGENWAERGKWFHSHVRELRPDQIDFLHLWWPEDGLQVEYRRAPEGRFEPIGLGSPGQKSAAILAFLLSYGEEPIILDQPEDDLDNHLIYDLIVRQLRENKLRRQVIVATHNPNIVVNGDAEQVISMDFRRGQCVVVESRTGCLQDPGVREEVCRVMEGGREAFEIRYQRLAPRGRRA